MACSHCPHCKSGGTKGALYSLSDLQNVEEQTKEKKDPPKFPPRGKAREYSKAFEIAWKAYPIKAQKFEAYVVWRKQVKETPEAELLPLILVALEWQKKGWAKEVDWYKPPYFERYLKRRKWEDEPPAPSSAPRGPDTTRAVDSKVTEWRATKPLTEEQIAELAAERRRLAESKAIGNG